MKIKNKPKIKRCQFQRNLRGGFIKYPCALAFFTEKLTFGTHRTPKRRLRPTAGGYSGKSLVPSPRVSACTSTHTHTPHRPDGSPAASTGPAFCPKRRLFFSSYLPDAAPQNLKRVAVMSEQQTPAFTFSGSLISATPPRTGSLLFSNLFLLECQKPRDLKKKEEAFFFFLNQHCQLLQKITHEGTVSTPKSASSII